MGSSSRVIGSCSARSPIGSLSCAKGLQLFMLSCLEFLAPRIQSAAGTVAVNWASFINCISQQKNIFQGYVKPKQLFWLLTTHLSQVPQPWSHFFVICTRLFFVRPLTRESYPPNFFLTSSWVRQAYRDENNGKTGPSTHSKEKIRRKTIYSHSKKKKKKASLKWVWLLSFS